MYNKNCIFYKPLIKIFALIFILFSLVVILHINAIAASNNNEVEKVESEEYVSLTEPTTKKPGKDESTTEEPTTEEFIPTENPLKAKKGQIVASNISHILGKVTAKDARKALRFSASLESLTLEEQTAYDIDLNGKITSFDAKLLIRIATNLDDYFIMNDGSRLSGWTIDNNNNKYYRNSYGAKLRGWQDMKTELSEGL